ncbi:Bug family tripartite tricarboxylate transporter substrate binding protein [Albibacillus kandeliae]|uniref:Bug family tripartite tricarboxylate transporter substrate binding protein n=1 Tax=Albibacillus kandeliae TaxID=2174228 RepID=UPI000D6931C3|nr:tripartite tricarboxylate transporter substrate binding protein [Albibacillus kandeliae]
MKAIFAALAACFVSSAALAEDFPSRQVTIVVPYSAGGVTDTYVRKLQPELQKRWGQTIIVENKPGSGSLLGAMDVASADPDGYTILVTAYGVISNEVLMPEAPFELSDLSPVYMLGRGSNMLIMRPDYPMDGIEEITAWAKEHPGELKLASSGVGASPHIAAELWASKVGVDYLHIPYQGSAPSRLDVMAGRVDGMMDGVSSVSYVRSGDIKAIAIAAEERHPSLPDVPTFREAGIDFVFGTIFGVYVAKDTPQAVQDEIYAAFDEAANVPEVHEMFVTQGLDATHRTQAEFKEIVAQELVQLEGLVEEGRLTPQ